MEQRVCKFKRDMFGTDIIVLHTADIARNKRGFEPATLLSLARIGELDGIVYRGNRMIFGANANWMQVEQAESMAMEWVAASFTPSEATDWLTVRGDLSPLLARDLANEGLTPHDLRGGLLRYLPAADVG